MGFAWELYGRRNLSHAPMVFNIMASFLRSLITAILIASAVLLFTVKVVAPVLPPLVGPPDLTVTKTLKLPAANTLRLANADGAIRIRTHSDPTREEIEVQADIKVYFRAKADLREAEAYIASLIQAKSTSLVLDIVTEPEDRPSSLDLRVDYTIVVPSGTNIETVGSNGNIWISKGCGRVTVRGDNSDIEIVEPAGTVNARNTNGRIRVLDAANDTTLETINGNIYAHMRGGSLNATTANGHILAWVLDKAVKACDLTSQNGGITVVLKADSSATLDAVTGQGTIRSDFAIDGPAGVQGRKQLHGVIGPGETRLTMETLNGSIWIRRG